MTAVTPTFEDFQKFSKDQLEAFTAASTTLSKGLQDIAAESSDYSKKAFAAGTAMCEKLLGARSVEDGGSDSERIRQAGLRGLCRPGDEGLRALHPRRFRRSEAGHHGLREPAEVIGRSVAAAERGEKNNFVRADAGAFQAPAFYLLSLPSLSSAAAAGTGKGIASCVRRCGLVGARLLRVTNKLAMLPFGDDIWRRRRRRLD